MHFVEERFRTTQTYNLYEGQVKKHSLRVTDHAVLPYRAVGTSTLREYLALTTLPFGSVRAARTGAKPVMAVVQSLSCKKLSWATKWSHSSDRG